MTALEKGAPYPPTSLETSNNEFITINNIELRGRGGGVGGGGSDKFP